MISILHETSTFILQSLTLPTVLHLHISVYKYSKQFIHIDNNPFDLYHFHIKQIQRSCFN